MTVTDSLLYSSGVVVLITTKNTNAVKPKPMQNSSEKTQKRPFNGDDRGVYTAIHPESVLLYYHYIVLMSVIIGDVVFIFPFCFLFSF